MEPIVETENVSEQMMKETMEHLKDEHERFEEENKLIKEELKEWKKAFSSVYGTIRLLDMMVHILDEDIPLDLINHIELLRSFTSDIFEQNVLMLKE
tara:strand:- start:315 stop:605 length:291 start_codon:yes stop_codon:yes gene_type:complete